MKKRLKILGLCTLLALGTVTVAKADGLGKTVERVFYLIGWIIGRSGR